MENSKRFVIESADGKTLLRGARADGLFKIEDLVALFIRNDILSREDLAGLCLYQESELSGAVVEQALTIAQHCRKTSRPTTTLTPRQQEIIPFLLDNKQNKEIANALNVSVRTIKFHISNLLAEFRCKTRVELAVKWREWRGSQQESFTINPLE